MGRSSSVQRAEPYAFPDIALDDAKSAPLSPLLLSCSELPGIQVPRTTTLSS